MKNWPRTSGVVVIKNLGGTISWGEGDKKQLTEGESGSRCYKSIMFIPTFCQISEHLQYALLTKLLCQFTEVYKSQFLFLFSTAFWKIRFNLTP